MKFQDGEKPLGKLDSINQNILQVTTIIDLQVLMDFLQVLTDLLDRLWPSLV